MTLIQFDRKKLRLFKRAYHDSIKFCPGDSFMFEGNEYLKDYAKYLIQYIETKIKKGA